MTHKSACLNCGAAFVSERPRGTVYQCSRACRVEFNNRRASRGAEIYDLMMAVRYEREAATEQALWSKACALLASFKAEDETDRAGRRSWQDHKAVTARKPAVYAARVFSTRTQVRPTRKAAQQPSLPI